MWFRYIDIKKRYQDCAIIESDGTIAEEWRPCCTEFNRSLNYEVSNLGIIRDTNKNIIPTRVSHGYRVFYYLDQGVARQTHVKAVHRAVAEAFIPNPNRYQIVNHLDGNKFNDVVWNLEWANASMNTEHAYLRGLTTSTRYDEAQIRSVCKLISEGVPQVQISYITGVDRKVISDIYRGRRWANIASQYVMPSKKWNKETKDYVCESIIAGKKGKEIFDSIGIEYNQSAISFYERMRRELKSLGKI